LVFDPGSEEAEIHDQDRPGQDAEAQKMDRLHERKGPDGRPKKAGRAGRLRPLEKGK
jgi:hypothetical protein